MNGISCTPCVVYASSIVLLLGFSSKVFSILVPGWSISKYAVFFFCPSIFIIVKIAKYDRVELHQSGIKWQIWRWLKKLPLRDKLHDKKSPVVFSHIEPWYIFFLCKCFCETALLFQGFAAINYHVHGISAVICCFLVSRLYKQIVEVLGCHQCGEGSRCDINSGH